MTDEERALLYAYDKVISEAAEAPAAAPGPRKVVSSSAMPRGCSAEVWGRLSTFLTG